VTEFLTGLPGFAQIESVGSHPHPYNANLKKIKMDERKIIFMRTVFQHSMFHEIYKYY